MILSADLGKEYIIFVGLKIGIYKFKLVGESKSSNSISFSDRIFIGLKLISL